jgi:hypothetical protein
MATMLTEVCDALCDAQGVTEEKAHTAGEAAAAFDTRFGKVETKLAIVTWMIGLGVALNVAILLKLFTH